MYVAAVIIAAGFVLFYCSYQIRLGAYVRTLCRNRAAGRVVALTFDDGPDPEMTPRVLDLLRERGVRATFFLVGAKAGGASTNTGNGYELEAIAACTIGGVSTNGGVGKVSGVLVGVLVFELMKVALQFMNVNSSYTYIVQGLVIIVAVAIDIRKYLAKK